MAAGTQTHRDDVAVLTATIRIEITGGDCTQLLGASRELSIT